MLRKLCWLNLPCGIVCFVLLGHLRSIQGQNYPAETFNPKPCAKLKNTITYQEPICLDDGHGGFEAQSAENCNNTFRLTCPEFNRGECMRYGPDNRPCCRLKYFADYTWMEIYYSMQYGPTEYDGNVPPNDIIEIHRRIKKHADFGNRDQEDYPENVLDQKGERGLTWTYVYNLTEDTDFSADGSNPNEECLDPKKTCGIHGLLDYVHKHYAEGFDAENHKIELNTYERDHYANVTTSLSPDRCVRVLLNRTVVGACQIIYSRVSVTSFYTTSIPFLEVNFFRDTTSNKSDRPLFARYAYYYIEDAEMRDQIFAFKTPK